MGSRAQEKVSFPQRQGRDKGGFAGEEIGIWRWMIMLDIEMEMVARKRVGW